MSTRVTLKRMREHRGVTSRDGNKCAARRKLETGEVCAFLRQDEHCQPLQNFIRKYFVLRDAHLKGDGS